MTVNWALAQKAAAKARATAPPVMAVETRLGLPGAAARAGDAPRPAAHSAATPRSRVRGWRRAVSPLPLCPCARRMVDARPQNTHPPKDESLWNQHDMQRG